MTLQFMGLSVLLQGALCHCLERKFLDYHTVFHLVHRA